MSKEELNYALEIIDYIKKTYTKVYKDLDTFNKYIKDLTDILNSSSK